MRWLRICRPPSVNTSLYNPAYKSLDADQLHVKCEEAFAPLSVPKKKPSISPKQLYYSQSLIYGLSIAIKGRITASWFASVCRTTIDSPSMSLLQSIFQKRPLVRAPALQWDRSREWTESPTNLHQHQSSSPHQLTVTSTGLNSHPPWLPTPWSITWWPGTHVSCSCCGEGLLEIKCPFSKRLVDPTQVSDSGFYLKPTMQCWSVALSDTQLFTTRSKVSWQFVSASIATSFGGRQWGCTSSE